MSRYYEMTVDVKGVKRENAEKVISFLEKEWFDEVADDVRVDVENDVTSKEFDFSMNQVGYLCGGEGEEEFAERMYKGIVEINGKTKVDVVCIYLEDNPTTEYSFGDDEDVLTNLEDIS